MCERVLTGVNVAVHAVIGFENACLQAYLANNKGCLFIDHPSEEDPLNFSHDMLYRIVDLNQQRAGEEAQGRLFFKVFCDWCADPAAFAHISILASVCSAWLSQTKL